MRTAISKIVKIGSLVILCLFITTAIANDDGNTSFLNWLVEENGSGSSGDTAEDGETYDYFIDSDGDGIDDRLKSRIKPSEINTPEAVPRNTTDERSTQARPATEPETIQRTRPETEQAAPARQPQTSRSTPPPPSRTTTNVERKPASSRTPSSSRSTTTTRTTTRSNDDNEETKRTR